MRRRTLYSAVAGTAVALLAGCEPAPRRPGPTASPPSAAPSRRVAGWLSTGGFTPPGEVQARPPVLAVYDDGRVIADARYEGRLSPAELSELVRRVAVDLGTPAVATPTGQRAIRVADAPTTTLTVRSGGVGATVSVDALDEVRDQGGYPAPLYDARDRLDAVRGRVVAGGGRYTGDRVRLVVVPGAEPGSPTTPWPARVPLPVGETSGAPMTADLSGDAARTAAAQLTVEWRAYRTASGEPVRAAWRYLLPDE